MVAGEDAQLSLRFGTKSPRAFRTIAEVAEELAVPQHVLRFWESKFPQVRPLKRGGGRRYYRPDDIALLKRIGDLLYTQGYTIKGVQRLLRDSGTESTANPPAPETPIGREDLLAECLEELESIAARIRFITRGNSREF